MAKKTYKIKWVKYAESYVEAESEEEAKRLAEAGKDYDFEELADQLCIDPFVGNQGWEVSEAEQYSE